MEAGHHRVVPYASRMLISQLKTRQWISAHFFISVNTPACCFGKFQKIPIVGSLRSSQQEAI